MRSLKIEYAEQEREADNEPPVASQKLSLADSTRASEQPGSASAQAVGCVLFAHVSYCRDQTLAQYNEQIFALSEQLHALQEEGSPLTSYLAWTKCYFNFYFFFFFFFCLFVCVLLFLCFFFCQSCVVLSLISSNYPLWRPEVRKARKKCLQPTRWWLWRVRVKNMSVFAAI